MSNEFKARNGVITPVVTCTAAQGTPPLVVSSTTPVANLSIGGNAATVTTIPTLSGDVSNVGNNVSISSVTVTGKLLTGFVSASGTVSASDSILSALNKIDGNVVALQAINTITNLYGGNNTTLLGSIPYQSNTNITSLLAPNTTTTKKYLTQTGNGTNGAAPVWNALLATDVPTLNQDTTGTAAKATILATARNIYGNSFNGSADLAQIISATYGGTNNAFTQFTGPTTSIKTFTLPDANATLLYNTGPIGTPSSGNLVNCTGINASNITNGILGQAYGGTGNSSGVYVSISSVTASAVSKLLVKGEFCTFTASGQTASLPASPTVGDIVAIGTGLFSDTVISRNGNFIMSLTEDMTLDKQNSVTMLMFIGSTVGWKLLDLGTIFFQASIFNLTNTWNKAQRQTDTVLTSSGNNISIDFNYENFSYTTVENTTLNFPINMPSNGQTQSGVIKITQGSTPRTLAFASGWTFPDGFNTITQSGNAFNLISYVVISNTLIYAWMV
jgi:hypothetical protein